MRRPVVWLLSAYRSDSHAWWADWLRQTLDEFEWVSLELPGRHFRWRIRGNPLSWLDTLPTTPPDLIIATSMVDLSTIKGLTPQLAKVPCIYYFHENQFAYPVGEHQVRSIEPQMVQLYGALSADVCLFNSDHNKQSFLDGIDALLKKMPDHVPDNVSGRLRARSSVLPVPINPLPAAAKERLILWNHRWEYDKAPEVFVEAMLALAAEGTAFELALLGPRGDRPPACLQVLRDALPGHIRHDGMLPRDDYERVLAAARLVVSTAVHEFQGLSVLEAVSAGAIPVVPDALCYPEQYPTQFRYTPGDPAALLDSVQHWLESEISEVIDINDFSSDFLRGEWSSRLSECIRD